MTRKYVSEGNTLNWTNTSGADVVSGKFVKVGTQIGVALVDIANGAKGAVALEGVFSGAPKVSGAEFVQGEKLVWDISANDGAGAFDDSAASPAAGDLIGAAIAWEAGSNGQTTCTVKLTPGNTEVATGGGG